MKTMKWMLGIAALLMVAVSCGTKKESPKKVLVLYYSQTSNTKKVAQEIAGKLAADIEEIVPVQPYDSDFQATIARCNEEREQGITPEIKPIAANLNDYDTIFIGYPIWFGTYAPPMAAFINNSDLSGKTIVPFCTFGSGGLESSVKDLEAKQPKANILAGYGVRAARMAAMPQEVDQFLKEIGMLDGDFTKPDDFSEQQKVTEDQAKIFDAAVGDYPMIHAKATTVASRTIPGGTEYLFTAVDLPREDAPKVADDDKSKMPPPGEMKVYVTVMEGEAPVFTRVVR
jgi:flavodoxin